MPPKTRITRDMLLDAAFQIARENGIESVNARTVAQRLGCSTQPVLYSFATVDELRRETYERADAYQSAYIMNVRGEDMMLEIGLNYVRFAATEKHLFRLLFQSDHFRQQSLDDLLDAESIQPLLHILTETLGVGPEAAKDALAARFLLVHGMASMLANNSMAYDEDAVLRLLTTQFNQ